MRFAPPKRKREFPLVRKKVEPEPAPAPEFHSAAFPELKRSPAPPPRSRPQQQKRMIPNPDFDNWTSAKDPETGDVYYWHEKTQATSWDPPPKMIEDPNWQPPKQLFEPQSPAPAPSGGEMLEKVRPPGLIVQQLQKLCPRQFGALFGEMNRAIIDMEQAKCEAERKTKRAKEDIEELTAVNESLRRKNKKAKKEKK